MNQNFTSSQLIKLCNAFEKRDYSPVESNLEGDLDSTFQQIKDQKFDFAFEKIGKYYRITSLPKKLVLRKLNDNISRIYQDKQANRRLIIKQLTSLLEETAPFWVLKTDIKSFYESINRKYLFQKFKDDTILSYHSSLLIDEIDKFLEKQLVTGLPRGVNISATLSEIYLRKFDQSIKQTTSVYYYARFVDDILIFCTSKMAAEKIRDNLNFILPKGLTKNKSKTNIFNGNSISTDTPLIYLGYKFWIGEKEGKKILNISISDNKVKRIKTKIAKSFFNYLKTRNFELLRKRIKFLTGNYSVRTSVKTNDLLAGIYYNYPSINRTEVLCDLNIYYRKLLCASKGKLGSKIKEAIDASQLEVLKQYSFKSGFQKKMIKRFTKKELMEITSCWK